MLPSENLPENPRLCPNCQAPLPPASGRCGACGKSLRPPVLRFDLETASLNPPAPVEAPAPATLLPAPVWDRLLGATLPFVLSLLWIGGIAALQGPERVAEASLWAAPVLRFLLPLVGALALRPRLPYLAGGFRNALTLVFQLLSLHVLILPIYVALTIAGLVDSILHTTWDCWGRTSPPRPAPALTFAPTAGLAATTLIVQGTMASILPFEVLLTKTGVRLSRHLRSLQGYGALGLVILLALAWWVTSRPLQLGLGIAAALLSALLALLRIKDSPDLSPKGRHALTALVLLVTVLSLSLLLLSSGTAT